MYGIQEILQRTEAGRKEVGRNLDDGFYHPADASILNGLKPAEAQEVKDSIRNIPLEHLIREYLAKSGTTGLAGAAYLIPDKIYDIMFTAAAAKDLAPLCSTVVTCPGSSLKVDVEVDGSFVVTDLAAGAKAPDETMRTTQVTITPKLFGIHPAIASDLIEDSQFDVLEMHIRRAAEEMGEYSTHQWLAAMFSGAAGDGTQNASNTATADKTYLADLVTGYTLNLEDGYHSDIAVIGPGPFGDIMSDGTVAIYADQFHTKYALANPPLFASEPDAFFGTFVGMKVYVDAEVGTAAASGGMYQSSKYHSLVLNKANASLTVRKRWLKLEKYSDPVRDLVGAVITARQACATIYNDASCELTEV